MTQITVRSRSFFVARWAHLDQSNQIRIGLSIICTGCTTPGYSCLALQAREKKRDQSRFSFPFLLFTLLAAIQIYVAAAWSSHIFLVWNCRNCMKTIVFHISEEHFFILRHQRETKDRPVTPWTLAWPSQGLRKDLLRCYWFNLLWGSPFSLFCLEGNHIIVTPVCCCQLLETIIQKCLTKSWTIPLEK